MFWQETENCDLSNDSNHNYWLILMLEKKKAEPTSQFLNFSRVVDITDNLCTKQGNLGLKSRVYNQEQFQIKSGCSQMCSQK